MFATIYFVTTWNSTNYPCFSIFFDMTVQSVRQPLLRHRSQDREYCVCRITSSAAILHRSSWTFCIIISEGRVVPYIYFGSGRGRLARLPKCHVYVNRIMRIVVIFIAKIKNTKKKKTLLFFGCLFFPYTFRRKYNNNNISWMRRQLLKYSLGTCIHDAINVLDYLVGNNIRKNTINIW